MAFKKGQSGNPAGKPKGATSKPKLSDYLTKDQVDSLVKKAFQMAERGNETMLKFVLEQNFGKAVQPTDMNIVGDMFISFDPVFDKKNK